MFDYNARVLEVVDGDTLKLDVDVGFRSHAFLTFRLARIDCPELVTLEGVAAKKFVVETLAKTTRVYIHSTRQEKFGRWLCEFYFETADQIGRWQHLNDILLSSGFARRYGHGRAVGVGLGTK